MLILHADNMIKTENNQIKTGGGEGDYVTMKTDDF